MRIATVTEGLAVGLSCRELAHTSELRLLGVTHWVDHRRTRCADELLRALPGVEYLWNPIRDDGRAKPLEWYEATLRFAREALVPRTGALLFVSCARGEHRGPSMAYAVLRGVLGYGREAALELLQSAWPLGDPWYADDFESKLEYFT